MIRNHHELHCLRSRVSNKLPPSVADDTYMCVEAPSMTRFSSNRPHNGGVGFVKEARARPID